MSSSRVDLLTSEEFAILVTTEEGVAAQVWPPNSSPAILARALRRLLDSDLEVEEVYGVSWDLPNDKPCEVEQRDDIEDARGQVEDGAGTVVWRVQGVVASPWTEVPE